MPVISFLMLLAVFGAIMALAGVLALVRRLDRVERRRVYETECLVKSLQALEQQNVQLAERLNAMAEIRSSISKAISSAARRQAAATEEEQTAQAVIPPNRLLH